MLKFHVSGWLSATVIFTTWWTPLVKIVKSECSCWSDGQHCRSSTSLYVHRDHKDYQGWGGGGGAGRPPRLSHSFWALTLCSSSVLLYIHRDHKDYLGQGAQDSHLYFHTASELWHYVQVQCCFTSTETIKTIWDREPRTATSTFTQLLSSDTMFKFSVALHPQRP